MTLRLVRRMEEHKKIRSYIVVWTNVGFNELNETTRYERDKTLEHLGGKKAQQTIDLHGLLRWCAANGPLDPEIWAFQLHMDREGIMDLIRKQPDEMRIAIRGNGRPLYRNVRG